MSSKSNNKVHVITLGCAKNVVDSEHLMKQLEKSGFGVEYDRPASSARNVIINTCGFINDAKQESIDTILAWANAKNEGKIDKLFVMGCLSERYNNELKQEIPEVDGYYGVNNIQNIVEKLGGNLYSDLLNDRVLTTPSHYAYLKISEGCDHLCSFCAIPLIRGKHVSRSSDDILTEARNLVQKGVKEIILVAQDLTYYGIDTDGKQTLPLLLDKLASRSGAEWIRLHYAYPSSFPRDLIKVINSYPNICKYLDIPFQHISDNMLKIMRRGIGKKQTLDLINLLRREIPDLTLRTTLIAGHPGETINDFQQLIDFVGDVKFDRLGIFPYSHEEQTWSYKNYEDKISEETKTERVEAIMSLQQEISAELNQSKVGKTLKTLIDRKEDNYWVGRTDADSPEVDNEVIINTSQNLQIGTFANVMIQSADDYDLNGIL
jgi:ribosomal protein S12 methylthiotransferase